jgi:hypothetical protein
MKPRLNLIRTPHSSGVHFLAAGLGSALESQKSTSHLSSAAAHPGLPPAQNALFEAFAAVNRNPCRSKEDHNAYF